MQNNCEFKTSIASCQTPTRKDPVLFGGQFTDCIGKAAALGFDALEIHVRDPLEMDAQALIETCKKNGIKISGVATGMSYANDGLCLIHPDVSVRKAAVKRLRDFSDFAQKLDAAILIGRMKGDINDMSKYDESIEILADGMRQVGSYAKDKGVRVMLEAINRYESNYMTQVGEIADFLKEYEIPSAMVLMDVFHMNIEEVDISKSIRKYSDWLGYFHVVDSNRLYPSAGHVDFDAVFAALGDIKYKGYVSLECMPKPDGETAAKRALDYISQFRKMKD